MNQLRSMMIVLAATTIIQARPPNIIVLQRRADASSCDQTAKAQCHATFNTEWTLCGAGASDSEDTKAQCRESAKEEAKSCLSLAGCSD